MSLLNEWLDYLEAQVGRGVYVYGAQGQKATEVGDVEAWIDRRSTSESTAKRRKNTIVRKRRKSARKTSGFSIAAGWPCTFSRI